MLSKEGLFGKFGLLVRSLMALPPMFKYTSRRTPLLGWPKTGKEIKAKTALAAATIAPRLYKYFMSNGVQIESQHLERSSRDSWSFNGKPDDNSPWVYGTKRKAAPLSRGSCWPACIRPTAGQ